MFDYSYMGGFFDGEGCITIIRLSPNPKQHRKSPQHKCMIVISNTRIEILEMFKNNFGGSIHIVKEDKENNRKKLYQWKIDHFTAYKFCLKMKDYFILKKRNAELVIEYYEKETGKTYITSDKEIARRDKLSEEIKKLNFRGVKV